MNSYSDRCTKIAERFLQTVVVFDDQAHLDNIDQTPVELTTPGRRVPVLAPDVVAKQKQNILHRLYTRPLVDAFAERGLICAIIAARPGTEQVSMVAKAAHRTDVVILDWQLDGDHGEKALSIIDEILNADGKSRLRLIAIYTGEQDLPGIGRTIATHLTSKGLHFEIHDPGVALSWGHCRIELYSKEGTNLPADLKSRSIPESQLPMNLINDFGKMTTGLLPSIALTSLATVRENAHKVLDKFHSELDAAFLGHRASLPVPNDSQEHIVSQIASELHALMAENSALEEAAGMEAIKDWLAAHADVSGQFNFAEGKSLSLEQTAKLLEVGLENNHPKLGKNDYKILTSGFAPGQNQENVLDQQLAWMINFRTVLSSPAPLLHLGTVLKSLTESTEPCCFVCMRPRCDSARLECQEAFLLLPLVSPKEKTTQMVIQTGRGKYRRVSVSMKQSDWSLVKFSPKISNGPVTADKDTATNNFIFLDSKGNKYEWLGEMKPEFAQRIAHRFAADLSRVAVDNSEWLRRQEHLTD